MIPLRIPVPVDGLTVGALARAFGFLSQAGLDVFPR